MWEDGREIDVVRGVERSVEKQRQMTNDERVDQGKSVATLLLVGEVIASEYKSINNRFQEQLNLNKC